MKNATMDIITKVSTTNLTIGYECKTDRVLYSIADFGGHLLKRGSCHDVIDNTIDISDLPKGNYTMCIVDGSELIKARFQKD
jgi:hypothetical protein